MALVALCVVVGLTVWLARRAADPTRHWNVLLVTLDTTRADHLTPYGYEHADTPTLEALSREGVTYERAYTPVPLTLPSHCTMMTGLLPSAHGILVNGASALDPEALTLAEILKRSGYATAAVVAAFVLDHRYGLDQGFDEYDDDLSRGTNPGLFYYAERNAELVTDAALTLLRQHSDRPLFLWVHYFDPHAPYEPPGFDPEDSEAIAYDAEIGYMDSQLGRLIDFVDGSDLCDNTLVIAVADHGEGLWEHGEATHGLFTYEGTLRVPLIVRFPDRRHAGVRIAQPVSVVDITPSVLAWTGLPVSSDLDGDELPLGPEDEAHTIYFENWHPQEFYGWSPVAGVVVGDWKLIDAPRRELFDLREDPYERENLYAPEDDRAATLLRALDDVRRRLDKRGSLATPSISMTEEIAAKLEALGYIAPGRSGPNETVRVDPEGKDPKDMISVYHFVLSASSEIENDRFVAATELLAEALSEDPTNKRAILLLAGLVSEEEVRRSALEALERIVDENLPADVMAEVRCATGNGLALEERPADAADAFHAALALDPNHTRARWGLVEALSELASAPEEIIPHLERLVAQAPGELRYVVPLARTYERLHREDDVIALYEAAVEARPDEPIAQNNLAWFNAKCGRRLDRSLDLIDAAISAEPEAATYHHTRGYVLWKLGRVIEALAAYETAVEKDPGLAECHYHLAIAYQELGDADRARDALGRAIELAEDDESRAIELAAAESPPWLDDAEARMAGLLDSR